MTYAGSEHNVKVDVIIPLTLLSTMYEQEAVFVHKVCSVETVTQLGVSCEVSPFQVGKSGEVCEHTKVSGTQLIGHETGTRTRM